MCVFTYVQSLCHSLSKIERERKDKEEKEMVGSEKEEKEGGNDAAGEDSCADCEKMENQEGEEAGGNEEEKDCPKSCEEENVGASVEA